MKGIEQIVRDAASKYEASSDEYVKYIVDHTNAEYATRKELDEKNGRIQSLSEQVSSLTERVESGKADEATLEDLKKQVEAYKEAETKRVAQEARDKAYQGFVADFMGALEGKTFANEPTKEHVLSKAFELREANPNMDVKAILSEVTKDQDGLWANPQGAAQKVPIPSNKNTQAELGAFAKLLFKE